MKVFGALKLPTLALLLAWSMQPKAIQSEPDMLQEPLLGGGSAPVLLLVPAGEFSMGSLPSGVQIHIREQTLFANSIYCGVWFLS